MVIRPVPLAALLVVLALGALSALAASASLASLALHRGDVRGLHQVQSTYLTNKQAAKLDGMKLQTLKQHGRELAYKSRFMRTHLKGVFDVENVVASYKTAAGARWDYQRVVKNARTRETRNRYPGYAQFNLSGVGKARFAETYLIPSRAHTLVVAEVSFYRGRYRVTIEAIGDARTTRPGDATVRVTSLARTVDARIRRYG